MRQVTFGGKLLKLPLYEIIRIRYDKIDMKKNYELLRNRKTFYKNNRILFPSYLYEFKVPFEC